MKVNFPLDKAIAAVTLLGAFLSVIAVAMSYGGVSGLPVNIVRFLIWMLGHPSHDWSDNAR